MTTNTNEAATILADAEADAARARSVVQGTYKTKYAQRALELKRKPKGVSTKAAARGNCDWLHLTLASLTLDEKGKLRVADFEAILDANGVKHDHWNRTTPGWQGRLRMTGRLALQRVVAEEEALYLPEGEPLTPPRNWIAKHQH